MAQYVCHAIDDIRNRMKRLITLAIGGAITAFVWNEERRTVVMEKAAAIARIASERFKSIS